MTIPKPVVIIGLGEMAGVFCRGFLRTGYPVYPVTREASLQDMAREVPDPELILLSVAEKDFHSALDAVPAPWRAKLVFLQNELLPDDWKRHHIQSPTVISVWFEKKKGQDFKVLIPSPVFGPKSMVVANALASLEIPTQAVTSEDQLLYELVLKNVYILTTNIAGLVVGGNVEALWNQHRPLAQEIASDIMDIQDSISGTKHDRTELLAGMARAIEGDLQHRCMGRSAAQRLQNAIACADQAGLKVPKLREIFQQTAAVR
jgi:hypothetical protein